MSISIDRARAVLSQFARQRILVVGDLMLDRYIHGAVSRISPEAPVPVVRVTQERSVPGGAANVAANIGSLGAGAASCGILGRDTAGQELRALLEKTGVHLDGCLDDPGWRTIVKTRVIAERQQVVRVDWEDDFELGGPRLAAFCERVDRETRRATGVIIEDYGKGLIQQAVVDTALKAAAEKGIPCGLDPKENHELAMSGITVATPNRKEAFAIARVAESAPQPDPLRDRALRTVSEELLSKWSPRLLVITLGAQGMLLASRGEAPRHVPTRAREVFDVSGAGDTVIAACVLSLAAGATPLEAAELANFAAGVVVGKLGTASCTQEELLGYMMA
jgi:D-beta-D-heptose 7-phosphate kinase/D-beta-D-heptose 1-phosphate adenosyltransferase